MKKIISTLIVAILVAFSALSVSATTTGITASEQKILDSLSATITTSDGSITIPDSYINQIKQYLLNKDVSDAQVSTIIAKIDDSKAITATVPGTSFSQVYSNMPVATKTQVIDIAKDAANVVGATLSINASSKTVTIVDPEAGTYTLDVSAIKKTGVSGNVVMSAVASLLLLGAVSYVILASRKFALSK